MDGIRFSGDFQLCAEEGRQAGRQAVPLRSQPCAKSERRLPIPCGTQAQHMSGLPASDSTARGFSVETLGEKPKQTHTAHPLSFTLTDRQKASVSNPSACFPGIALKSQRRKSIGSIRESVLRESDPAEE
ncbi:hypothetical protein EOD39_4340 [Acipenser ruthenus]|uniref:Uncharacterized protein n=1 Tax=Acipenser ruthenus TaxID=7906 RepID=A0A444UIV6_ACIRT|nr:hypothetical protein EOD39_4340 [Acipenser ruthenus]